MWPKTVDQRLKEWYTLRQEISNTELESALQIVNSWWSSTPWSPYYLHWDDIDNWPDPWQMLDDNVFCNVARGLGAVCTIVFLERADIIDAELVQTTNGDNLVVINNGDYILNWDKDSVRNKCSPFVVDRRLTQTQIKIKYL